LVDVPSIESRLARLDQLLVELDAIRVGGRPAYDAAFGLRLATQHAVQLAIQCCIDIAGGLAADLAAARSETYAGYFDVLRGDGLDPELAGRLGLAVGLRNILVHDYLDLDEDILWGSLDHLDDLREFAAYVVSRLDRS
jgi:uncharacterized protein YutE (UPF0331/DUF86 family)